MWNLPLQLFSLTVLQTGSLCLASLQPASSEAACDSAESCLGYKEPSGSAWYIWFCMWLLLAAILLCMALCCLQCWFRRHRGLSPQRTLAVFALHDVDGESVYDDSVAPEMLAKIHPHLRNLERDSADARYSTAGHGSPPSYEEITRPVSPGFASPPRGVAPGEQSARRGPSEGSQHS